METEPKPSEWGWSTLSQLADQCLGTQHDLRSTLQVEREFGGPRALLEDVHAESVDAEEDARHQEEAQKDPPGVTDRGRSGHV